jgi:hypothetical protein
MKTIRSVIMICASAFCLLVAAVPPTPRAADVEAVVKQQTADIERRVSTIEAMNLEHRLTKVESELDSMSLQTRGTMGGVGVLLIEGVMRLGKKKREEEA